MRRPLTANGVPVIQTAVVPNTPATILDLGDSDVDADAVLLVTLFCYIPLNSTSENRVSASVVTDSTSVTIGVWDDSATAAENTFLQYRDKGIGAAKLLDRVALRGDQQLVVESVLELGALWYGYYERVGETHDPALNRPLQPGALSDPYNAPFVSITSPADETTQTETVHALDNTEERLDFLTLYAYCESNVATADTPSCVLLVPGGIPIVIPIILAADVATGRGGQPVKVYEGIPVRAPDSTDNLIQVQVTGDGTAVLTTVVYGNFSRA